MSSDCLLPDFGDLFTYPLVSIPCTMCTKQEPSVCSCKTCVHYLCDSCNSAHKSMVCFQNHEIVSIDDDTSCIKPFLTNSETDRTSSTDSEEETAAKTHLVVMYKNGQKRLESMLALISEMQQNLDGLSKYRINMVGEVNEMYQQYQEHLRQQRDGIIQSLDEHLNDKQAFINSLKNHICEAINKLVLHLSSLKCIIRTNGIEGNGFEIGDRENGLFMCDNGVIGASLLRNSEENRLEIKQDFTNLLGLDFSPLTTANSEISRAASNAGIKRVNAIEIFKTFGQKGSGLGMLNSPHGFCLGYNEDIVVCDTSNHRVQVYAKSGDLKYQFGVSGRNEGHLWHPRKIALLPVKRQFVVCDRGYERSRMQIFTEDGKFLRRIHIQYIDIVSGIAINENENIAVVDSVTPTIFLLGSNEYLRSLDCSSFMEEPSDIAVHERNFYVCDFKAHNVCVVDEDGVLLRKIGNKQITTFPNGIDVTKFGQVLIGDSHGNFFHISAYTTDGEYIADYRCPYIKVSRCCGLKVTRDGNIVTVDKNYHHVIMLENIYALLPNV